MKYRVITCRSDMPYGICRACGRGHGYLVSLPKNQLPQPVKKQPRATMPPPNLLSLIKESRENIAYWTRQKILATQPHAKAEAGARVLLWQSNLKTLLEKQEIQNAAKTAARQVAGTSCPRPN